MMRCVREVCIASRSRGHCQVQIWSGDSEAEQDSEDIKIVSRFHYKILIMNSN